MSRTYRKFQNKTSGMFPNTYRMKSFIPDVELGYRVRPVGQITMRLVNDSVVYDVISSGLVSQDCEQAAVEEYKNILVKLTRDSANTRGPNSSYRKNRENQFRASTREAISKIYKYGEYADYFNKGPKSAAWDWY